jgi:hypothetical protein
LIDCLGRSISELKNHKFFTKKGPSGRIEQCEFVETPTKAGNPKGVYYTCNELGFQAFTVENTQIIQYIDVFNEIKD